MALASRLGFAAIGTTVPYLSQAVKDNFERWIKGGYQADMHWMEANPEHRTDLRFRFSWAKSVLVVADNYYYQQTWGLPGPRVSRYAWGKDYHLVLMKKLRRLIVELNAHVSPIKAKAYVDTGPVLEKAFAVQAGLGWQGKHSNIIIPGVGSYCFLGIVVLSVPAEPFEEVKDGCGDCQKCIRACPTGALVAPGVVDARRCIAYLTIEKKGTFSPAQKAQISPWLFGCDNCQAVCPWNQQWAETALDPHYYNRRLLLGREPGEWHALTVERFKQLFKDSVFRRLKYKGLQRNLKALSS